MQTSVLGRPWGEHEREVRELVRFCAEAYFDRWDFAISLTRIMNLLYRATASLPDGNPLKNSVPFYWYRHGPCSPPLEQLTGQLVSEGVLKPSGEGLVAAGPRLRNNDGDLEEPRLAILRMVSESPFRDSDMMTDKLYSTEAPYKFYTSFKNRFLGNLKSHLYGENTGSGTEDLKSELYGTIGDLPFHSTFSKFSGAYIDYVDIMTRLAEVELAAAAKAAIINASEGMFKAFADGVRILHHDAYYDSEVPGWRTEFDASVAGMERDVDLLHDLASSTGMADTGRLSFSGLVERALKLRSENRLIMVYFTTSKEIPELNDGHLDSEVFGKLNDGEFETLLRRFEGSYNAIVDYSDGNQLESVTYRLRDP